VLRRKRPCAVDEVSTKIFRNGGQESVRVHGLRPRQSASHVNRHDLSRMSGSGRTEFVVLVCAELLFASILENSLKSLRQVVKDERHSCDPVV